MLPFTKILRKTFVKMSILNINILDHFANALKNRNICVSNWKSDNIVSAEIIYGVNRSFVSGREGARVDFVEGRGRDSNGENSNTYP